MENVKPLFAETVLSARGAPPARELQLCLQHCISKDWQLQDAQGQLPSTSASTTSSAAAPAGSSDGVCLQRHLASRSLGHLPISWFGDLYPAFSRASL